MINAIQVYKSVIEFFDRNKHLLLADNKSNQRAATKPKLTMKEKVRCFKEIYQSKVNEKKAVENKSKLKKEKTIENKEYERTTEKD